MLDGTIPLRTALSGEVTLLRLSSADAAAFAAHTAGDLEHLGRFLGWPALTSTPDGAAGWLRAYERQEDGRVVAGGAWRGGVLLGGALLLHHEPRYHNVELGCWAVSSAAGTGLAAACCRELIRVARRDLQAERVAWLADTENVASRRLAGRLGFRLEGTQRSSYELDGVRRDLDQLSLVGAEIDATLTC
jgi:ribosomal-protein-serine acetyltransferase